MTSKELNGLRVLLTRPIGEGMDEWRAALEAEGASVIAYPTTEILPPVSGDPVVEKVGHLQRYGWIVFTSQTAVRHFAARCPDGRLPLGPSVAVIGSKTAQAVQACGRECDIVAKDASQEGLVEALSHVSPTSPMLFPRAATVRPFLGEILRSKGWKVDEVVAYRSEVASIPPIHAPFDAALFASPSALRGFLLKNPVELLLDRLLVAIGPTTYSYAKAMGLRPVMAERPDVHSVIRRICAFHRKQGDTNVFSGNSS